jgi:hypothetical protein
MAYTQFAQDQYFIVSTDDVFTEAGNFTLTESMEVGHIVCTLFKLGAHAGSESLQIGIFGNKDLSVPVALSDSVAMADIDTLTASGWAGRVRFDFDRQHLDDENTYYLGVRINNYTFADGSYYWAWALDWPDDINTYAVGTKRGLQFSLLGYK